MVQYMPLKSWPFAFFLFHTPTVVSSANALKRYYITTICTYPYTMAGTRSPLVPDSQMGSNRSWSRPWTKKSLTFHTKIEGNKVQRSLNCSRRVTWRIKSAFLRNSFVSSEEANFPLMILHLMFGVVLSSGQLSSLGFCFFRIKFRKLLLSFSSPWTIRSPNEVLIFLHPREQNHLSLCSSC